jgi:hypothetical protein
MPHGSWSRPEAVALCWRTGAPSFQAIPDAQGFLSSDSATPTHFAPQRRFTVRRTYLASPGDNRDAAQEAGRSG